MCYELCSEVIPFSHLPVEAGHRVCSFRDDIQCSDDREMVSAGWPLLQPCVAFYERGEEVSTAKDIIRLRKVSVEIPYSFFLLIMDTLSVPYIIIITAYSMFYLLFHTSVFICTEVLR